jgi:hypothetical protein
MKIKDYKQIEYIFIPLIKKTLKDSYTFKYKSDLMRFLLSNIDDALNGTVRVYVNSFCGSYTSKEYFVWYNSRKYKNGDKLKVELKKLNKHKKRIIPKFAKRWFAFSKKVISLMSRIGQEKVVTPKDAKKLYDLFLKRGFKDFEPTDNQWIYINGHISDGIPFWHWSDRCDVLRTKTVIEYFRRNNLI